MKHLFIIQNSSLEIRIERILKENNINFKPQYNIGRFFFDFIVFPKTLIEVNGDFWHANPNKYLEEDKLNFPGGKKIKAEDIWTKDKNKKDTAERNGYKVMYLWEKDMNKMTDDEIIKFIVDGVLDENQKNK